MVAINRITPKGGRECGAQVMDGVGNPTAPSQQTADLLRQPPVDDVPTWAVVTVWDARAARVCCDTKERGPMGEVVRLPGGTVTLQEAANAFLDHHDLARSTRRVYRASLASLVAELGPATAVGELSGQRLAG